LIEPSATNVDDLSVRRTEAAADIVVTPEAHGITGNDLAIGQRPKGCRCVTDITQQAKGNPSHLGEMAQQHAAYFDARSELSRQACEPAEARIDEDNDASLGNCKHNAIPLGERTIYVAADGRGRSELLLDAVFGATPSGLIEDENGVHVGATLVAISSR
jgi:hypothetical protein